MGSASDRAEQPSYGRYETLFRIAAGGMAEVYAARVHGEAGFQKLVALKRMLPHLCDDERFVTMFMDEGRLAANISSPHVVSTLDLGRASDESLYLVMELVVGVTMNTLVRNVVRAGARFPVGIAVELLAESARGLHDAHTAKTPFGAPLGIVHRDVSPQNILVGVDGRVRITDFGVARAMLRRTKTSTGELKGKLSYFSPEQCADYDLDKRSDVFSLGIVAWEVLTRKRLFHAENPLAVLEKVTRMPVPLASDVSPDVPRDVAIAVDRALTRDREKRYASAGEFEAALRAALRKHEDVPDAATIGAFVRAHGGETLGKMEAGIRRALASPRASPGDGPTTETQMPSGVVMRDDLRADDDDVLEVHTVATPPPAFAPIDPALAAAATQVRLDPATPASGSSGAFGAQLGTTHAIRPKRGVPMGLAIAGVVALIAIAGGAVWLAMSAQQPELTVVPLEPSGTLPPLPAAPPEVVAPVAPAEVAAPAEPTPELAAPGRPRTGRGGRTERPATAAAEPARAETVQAPEPEPEPVRADPPRAEAPRAEPRQEPRADPPRSDPPRSDPPRTEPRRAGGLLGVDDFERELGE